MDNTRIRLLEEMKSQIIVLLIELHNLVEVFIYLISSLNFLLNYGTLQVYTGKWEL